MADDVHITIGSDAAGGEGITISVDHDVTVEIQPPHSEQSTEPTE